MKGLNKTTWYTVQYRVRCIKRDILCFFLGHKYSIEDWELIPRVTPNTETVLTAKYPYQPKWVYLECNRCGRGTVEGDE